MGNFARGSRVIKESSGNSRTEQQKLRPEEVRQLKAELRDERQAMENSDQRAHWHVA